MVGLFLYTQCVFPLIFFSFVFVVLVVLCVMTKAALLAIHLVQGSLCFLHLRICIFHQFQNKLFFTSLFFTFTFLYF